MDARNQLAELGRHWVPPAGLDGSRPRWLRLTGGGKVLVIVSVLLCLGSFAAGFGLNAASRRQAEEVLLLREQGVVTDGQVIRLYRRGKDNEPYVSYGFLAQGREYKRDLKISRAMWTRLKVGSPLSVRYAESRPEINHPAGLTRSALPPWVPVLVAVALMICGAGVLLPLRGQSRLLANGRQTMGVVMAHGKTMRTSHGSELGKKYEYEFLLLSGASCKGTAGPVKNPPPIGSAIPVLYDPETPKRNAPYPLPLVRLARN
jgi:hypothetical protein